MTASAELQQAQPAGQHDGGERPACAEALAQEPPAHDAANTTAVSRIAEM